MEFFETMSSPVKRVKHSNLWQLRIGERKTLLMIGDLLAAIIALLISLYYWGSSERFLGFTIEFLEKRTPIWFYFLPLVWLLLMVEQYDIHKAADWKRTLQGVIGSASLGVILYMALYFYYSTPPGSLLPRRGVASFVILVTLLTLAWRWIYIKVFTASQLLRRALLIGAGKNGEIFLDVINQIQIQPFFLVGIVDDNHRKLGSFIKGHQVIGTSEQLLDIISENHISDVIVAISGEMQGKMFQALLDTQQSGVEIFRMPTTYEELLERVPILTLEANWLLGSFIDDVRTSGFFLLAKRLLDIIGGLLGIVINIIAYPFLALAIFVDDGLPIFYKQTRLGRGGVTYDIYKYRTMRRDAEPDGHAQWAQENDARATRVGRILRKTHLDELPQFINVLRGDMSLVGPRAERPELVDYFHQHIPFYRARLLVQPGITGWAQINFGYAASIEETIVKLEYDLYYIKNRSFWMDLVILLRTPATVFGFRGR